jgi:shikimate dehydrogenase
MRLDGKTETLENDAHVLRMGLLGRGIQLSRTPAMHEAEAAAQGTSSCYQLIDTDTDHHRELHQIIDSAEADGFAGLNVTFPYKQAVIPYLNQMSVAAERIGAVNTIVFKDGQRFGHNTDFWGFSESLRHGLPDVKMENVLLIGAGGAGAALAHALADMNVGNLMIADTREGSAAKLAKAVGPKAIAIQDISQAAAKADGIVNATPVGMAKLPGMPIDPALLESRHWVVDIIYFPLETELLKAARKLGCRALNGEGMAVFQAVRAFELFTGRSANADRMRNTFQLIGQERGS